MRIFTEKRFLGVSAASIMLLLMLAGCSSKTADDSALPEIMADESAEAAVQQDIADCRDQCYTEEAWCDRDRLYACVQEDCMKQVFIKECEPGFTCENSLFCAKEGESREGIMVLGHLMQAAPSIEGRIGDEFNLDYLGMKLRCTVTGIERGTALIQCD